MPLPKMNKSEKKLNTLNTKPKKDAHAHTLNLACGMLVMSCIITECRTDESNRPFTLSFKVACSFNFEHEHSFARWLVFIGLLSEKIFLKTTNSCLLNMNPKSAQS